jgi:flagellar hook-length control protein FliK
MEAVQMVQNPGTLVSGKIGASVTGQTGDATAQPIFAQMFAQATACAGTAEQAAVKFGLPLSAAQQVSLADSASLPLTGQIPVLLHSGDASAAESTVGEAAETSAAAKASMTSEAGLGLTQMLLRNLGKNGKTFERKDLPQGKNLGKATEPPGAQLEEEMKSGPSELAALQKQDVTVKSQNETDSTGNSISTEEKKSEGISTEDVATPLPFITPEFVATPTIVKESRTAVSGEVFTVPERSVFAEVAVGIGNGSETPSTVRREDITGSEPIGKAAGELKTANAVAFMKTGDGSMPAKTAEPTDIVVSNDSDDLKGVPASAMDKDLAARNRDQGADFGREKQAVVNAVKGETVLRQVPSGVTVANPAQTVLMGNSSLRAEMMKVTGQGREVEAKSVRETAEGNQMVSENLLSEADQAGTPKNISVLSGEGASQQNAGEGKEGRQVFAPISASGNFETALRGRTEEIRPTLERTELHESILSQVREKLAAPEAGNGNGQITLKLNPRELGDLQIHLRMQDSKVSVEITAQNPVVRDALVQNLDQLKETLSRQNIAMERFDVMNGNGQSSNQSFREGRQAAQPHFDDTYYPDAAYYPEDPGGKTLAFGDARQNTLVDMRF